MSQSMQIPVVSSSSSGNNSYMSKYDPPQTPQFQNQYQDPQPSSSSFQSETPQNYISNPPSLQPLPQYESQYNQPHQPQALQGLQPQHSPIHQTFSQPPPAAVPQQSSQLVPDSSNIRAANHQIDALPNKPALDQRTYAQAVDPNAGQGTGQDVQSEPQETVQQSERDDQNEEWVEVKSKKSGRRKQSGDKENAAPLKKSKSLVKCLTPVASANEIVDMSLRKDKLVETCYKIGNGWFIRSREITYGKNYGRVTMNALSIERIYGNEKKSIMLDIPWYIVTNFHIAVRKILASKRHMPSEMDPQDTFVDVSSIGMYAYTTKQFNIGARFTVRAEMREFTNDKNKSLWDVICVTKMIPGKKEGDEPKPFSQDIPAKFGPALEKALREIRAVNGETYMDMENEDKEVFREYGRARFDEEDEEDLNY